MTPGYLDQSVDPGGIAPGIDRRQNDDVLHPGRAKPPDLFPDQLRPLMRQEPYVHVDGAIVRNLIKCIPAPDPAEAYRRTVKEFGTFLCKR